MLMKKNTLTQMANKYMKPALPVIALLSISGALWTFFNLGEGPVFYGLSAVVATLPILAALTAD